MVLKLLMYEAFKSGKCKLAPILAYNMVAIIFCFALIGQQFNNPRV
jgi:hypothetical protein